MQSANSQIKRFVAPSMTQALALVREEMGPEAVILSSQKVKGGVEIITSVERDYHTRGVAERQNFGQNFDADVDHVMASDSSWQSQAGIEQAVSGYNSKLEINESGSVNGQDLAAQIERAREKMLAAKKFAAQQEQDSQRMTVQETSVKANREHNQAKHSAWTEGIEQEQKLAGLREEIADLRLLLEQQSWAHTPATQLFSQPQPINRSKVQSHLERLGLTSAVINELNLAVPANLRLNDVWKQSLAKLAQGIHIADDFKVEAGGCFAFVGPTGVGKTTTLSKLAAAYTLQHGPGKVALVSMDTHRVGAVEQLRTLSHILNVPLKIVDARRGLLTTLAELREFPLVLIDTAGFRQGDAMLVNQLAELDQCPQVRRLLVLSSLSQAQHLKATIHAYKPRKGRDACVLSKVDEACTLGESLSPLFQFSLPVAYITNGQQIPQDIKHANRNDLIASAVKLSRTPQVDYEQVN